MLESRVALVVNVYYKLKGSHFSKSKKTKHKKVLLICQERASDKGENKCHYFDLLLLKKICEKSYLN